MSRGPIQAWVDKIKVLGYLRSRSKRNTIRVYFLTKTEEIVLIRSHKRFDEIFYLKCSSIDYATIRRYSRDGAFLIYNGYPKLPVVDFLIKSRYKWRVVARKLT
ncbi:TPA: hypothetical protein VCH52_001696 [Streptococcus pyogenes]|nr:hypothetical protein [Streptococcus pyogenes]